VEKGSTTERKRALRSALIEERARLSPDQRVELSRRIAERARQLPAVANARLVAVYAPLGTEVDALELVRLLGAEPPLLPRVVAGTRRLEFARCAVQDLARGPLGVRQPPAEIAAVDPEQVDCVVLPGIGFSLHGLRLGRGGGYYDATLREMPHASRVGLAFEVQVLPELPFEPHDARLDALVTEARTLTFDRDPS
jgi:5-formyltetrahydrofolate cyclo-ligase